MMLWGETRFMLPLLTKERVGVRFKELSTLIEMLSNFLGLSAAIINFRHDIRGGLYCANILHRVNNCRLKKYLQLQIYE
jgi:hypothetical protein